MRVYKLTDSKGQTYGGMQWGKGITHTASGEGELCTKGWIHGYTHPLLAVLLDPIHGDYLSEGKGILWEAEAEGEVKSDHGLKVGVTSLTTRRRVPVPPITMEQRVRFGLLCALEVYHEASWVAWARGWLEGIDRSTHAANDAYRVARAAIDAAYHAYGDYGAEAAAADAAAYAAYTGARPAYTATRAANAADAAARAAACVAEDASQALNLIAIAEEALSARENAI